MISPWHGRAIAAYGSSPSALPAESPSAPDQLDSFVPPADYNRGVGRSDVLARFQVCHPPPEALPSADRGRHRTIGRAPDRKRSSARTASWRIGTSDRPASRISHAATPLRVRELFGCRGRASAPVADGRDRPAPRAARRCQRTSPSRSGPVRLVAGTQTTSNGCVSDRRATR